MLWVLGPKSQTAITRKRCPMAKQSAFVRIGSASEFARNGQKGFPVNKLLVPSTLALAALIVLAAVLLVSADEAIPVVGVYACGNTTPFLNVPDFEVREVDMVSTTFDSLDVFVLPEGWAA